MPFSALLDANVLVPNALRDTLLRIAEEGLYRPLWSAEILAEAGRAVLWIRPNVDPERLERMFEAMNRVFDDAMIDGYQSLVEGLTNDPGDRHVVAAAVAGRADVIVTNNVKHFPEDSLGPLHIEVLTPDRFLCLQYDLRPQQVVNVLRRQSAETGRSVGKPRLSLDDLLGSLDACGVPEFTDLIRGHLAAATIRPRVSPERAHRVTEP